MSRYFNSEENRWRLINTNTSLRNSERLLIDVTNGAIVIQLNQFPIIGESLEFIHVGGDIVSNPIIIDPLENKIDLILGEKIIQQPGIEVKLVYNGVEWSSEIGEDTLLSVTSRGSITTFPIKIQNPTKSTSVDSGALVVDGGIGVNGDVNISGRLQVHGKSIITSSTSVNVTDPKITLGGLSSTTIDDNKDRGVEFRWHNGTVAKTGFFGFDDSIQKFTFIPDAIENNDIFSGAIGEIQAKVDWSNINSKPNTLLGYGITTQYANLNANNVYTGTQFGNGQELNNWKLTNISRSFFDKGTIGSGLVQFDYQQAVHQRVQVYNAVQLQVINWPQIGELGEIMIELVNGASATITWPIINWICPDGSITNNFSYSGVALQLNGIDWVILWTRNAGATIYGKVIR